jgi:hypothetical protein
LEGPSRSFHGEGNRQYSAKPDGMLDLSGVEGGGTFPGEERGTGETLPGSYSSVNTSGKDRAYKAGRRKTHGAGRESEGFIVPEKACSKTRRREGTLL